MPLRCFNIHSSQHFFVFVLLAVAVTGLRLQAQPAVLNFRAEGTLIEHFRNGSSSAYAFSVEVHGCRWLIRTTPGEGAILYYEDSYDGTNVYTYRRLKNPSADIANKGTAQIEVNDVPNRKWATSVGVWLAYASACYFEGVRDDRVKPFLLFGDSLAKQESISVEWNKAKSYPFLPSYIRYAAANRTYNVVAFTNVQNLTIPCEFILEAAEVGLSSSNSPAYRLLGTLTNFQTDGVIQDFRPGLVGATYTEDRRFATKSAADLKVIYNNTNTDWVSKDNAQLARLARQSAVDAQLAGDKTNKRDRRLFVVLFLAVPTVAAILFAVKKAKSG